MLLIVRSGRALLRTAQLVAGLLLVLNVIGLIRPPVPDSSSSETAPSGYYTRLREVAAAQTDFKRLRSANLGGVEAARELTRIVFESFVHTRDGAYLITPFDNWYLWLRGQFDPRFLQSQDGDFLWERGGGYCDQAAMIYVTLARRLGMKAYLVWLGGHVIATVAPLPGVWHLADPDMGLYWEHSLDDIGAALDCSHIREGFLMAGYSERLAEKISAVYCSKEDNRATDVPYAATLAATEKRAAYIRWLLPLALIIVPTLGLRLWRQ